MRRLVSLVFSALAALVLALPAVADAGAAGNCKVRVRPDTTWVRLIYDPLEHVQVTEQAGLSFTPRMKDCTYGLAIGGSGTGLQRQLAGSGGKLNYRLEVKGTTVANDLNAASVTIIPNPGRGPAGSDQGSGSETIKVVVAAGQFAPAGSYRDEITLRMFDISSGVPVQLDQDQVVTIEVTIPARAQINLAGGISPVFGGIGGSGLHFGELQAGAERDAYIQVRATSPIMLTLSSENKNNLRHKVEKTAVPQVPYALTVDNEPIDLRHGSKRIDRAPTRGLGADNYRMVARILDVEGRVAGEYQDVITVTVEPK